MYGLPWFTSFYSKCDIQGRFKGAAPPSKNSAPSVSPPPNEVYDKA